MTGIKYNISIQNFVISAQNLAATVTRRQAKYENTVIWDGVQNAQYVFDRNVNLNQRDVKILLSDEKAGSYLEVDALYDEKIDGYVTQMSIDLSKGFTGSAKIEGVIV